MGPGPKRKHPIGCCSKCGAPDKKTGHAWCHDCWRESRRKRYADNIGGTRDQNYTAKKRQQDFIDKIKDLPCQDCGGRFPPECMDFDHRDPELKSFTIKASRVLSDTTGLMLEVSKCDLVCANCHRIRTKKQRRLGIVKANRKYA